MPTPTTVSDWLQNYAPKRVPPGKWPHTLWNHAWFNQRPIVTEELIHRPAPALLPEGVDIPQRCLVMQGFDKQLYNFNIDKALVRTDYINIINQIISLYEKPTQISGKSEEMDSQVDYESEFRAPIPLATSFESIDIQKTRDNSHQPVFIVTGSPGNGKSIFLHLYLGLRLRARLPTIFQVAKSEAYLFTEYGAHVLVPLDMERPLVAAELGEALEPSGGWCLVDSNNDLENPPGFLLRTSLPMLQTSYPHKSSIHWATKHGTNFQFIMNPFTLSEAIIVRGFHSSRISKVPSEIQLVEWFRDFVPNARLAFYRAANKELYEETRLRCRVKNCLSVDSLDALARQMLYFYDSYNSDLGEEIFILLPSLNYQSYKMIIATAYLTKLLCTELRVDRPYKRLENYQLSLGFSPLTPITSKLFAGLALERLSSEGVWPLVPLKSVGEGRFSNWIVDKASSPFYLHVSPGLQGPVISGGPEHTTSTTVAKSVYDKIERKKFDLKSMYLSGCSEQAACYCDGDTTCLLHFAVTRETHVITRRSLELVGAGLGAKVIFIGIFPTGYGPTFRISQEVEREFFEDSQLFLLEYDPA